MVRPITSLVGDRHAWALLGTARRSNTVVAHWDESLGGGFRQGSGRNPLVPLAVSPMSVGAGKCDKNRLPSGVPRARRVVES